MKIGVCLKQVPATDTRVRVNATGTGIVTDDVKFEINPYDEYALEQALRIKGTDASREVIVFTLGGAECEPRVRDALARGADRAVRVDDPAIAGSDALGVARVLAAALSSEGVNLALCGRQAIDGDSSAVPAMIAELLGWNQVTYADAFTVDGEAFTAQRAAGGGVREVVAGNLPVVVSCDKGMNEPRSATLPGIMKAKAKKIDVKGLAALGVDAGAVGAGAAVLSQSNMGLPPGRPPGRTIGGSPTEAAAELVRLLREEAKVI